MAKEEGNINNKYVNEVFNSVRKVFSKELLKHEGMTFEEMDIVIYRLKESLFQSKLDLYRQWQSEEHQRPKPSEMYK